MKVLALALVVGVLAWSTLPVLAADGTKVKDATRSVESGAEKIGAGVEETGKGIGKTLVETAKVAGEKLKEWSKAAEPEARSTWDNVKDNATYFRQSVKSLFGRLFSD